MTDWLKIWLVSWLADLLEGRLAIRGISVYLTGCRDECLASWLCVLIISLLSVRCFTAGQGSNTYNIQPINPHVGCSQSLINLPRRLHLVRSQRFHL